MEERVALFPIPMFMLNFTHSFNVITMFQALTVPGTENTVVHKTDKNCHFEDQLEVTAVNLVKISKVESEM